MGITTGQFMKQTMKAHKITQQELANKLGLGRSTVGMYVSDNAIPSEDTWDKIIEALGINKAEATKVYSDYCLALRCEKRTAAKVAVKEEYGSTIAELLDKADRLTNEGLKKLLDRAEELLDHPLYNEEYQEYLANTRKDREA